MNKQKTKKRQRLTEQQKSLVRYFRNFKSM